MTTFSDKNNNISTEQETVGPESWEVQCETFDGRDFRIKDIKTLRVAFREVEILERRLIPSTIKSITLTQSLEKTMMVGGERVNDR